MKITVKITKEILRESANCQVSAFAHLHKVGQNCAIGLAIFQLFGDMSWVYKRSIGIFYSGMRYIKTEFASITADADVEINLPYDATAFIDHFDSCTPEQRLLISPFSFEIEVPEQLIQKIGIGEVYRILSESKTLELVM